jgi:hypothetical protein
MCRINYTNWLMVGKRQRLEDKKDSGRKPPKTARLDVSKTGPGDLTIVPIETSKDLIDQPALASHDAMYIPPLGSSVIISGKSGSGKSTLLANLMLDPRFYGPGGEKKPAGYFKKVFLFSPTANGDDVQKSLNIPKSHVFTDLEDAAEMLDVILDSQQSKIDSSDGADKVDQFAIIFDDVIGDTKFMNQKAFTRCFYQVRHVNCTTFICTQHFKRVPKVCRLQANFVFFFAGSLAEVVMITEEYAPPNVRKVDFMVTVNDVTSKDRFTFLTINNKVPADIRFRENLATILTLPTGREVIGEEKSNTYESRNRDNLKRNLPPTGTPEETPVDKPVPAPVQKVPDRGESGEVSKEVPKQPARSRGAKRRRKTVKGPDNLFI